LFKPAIDGKSDAWFPSMSRTTEAQIDNPPKKNPQCDYHTAKMGNAQDFSAAVSEFLAHSAALNCDL